MILYVKYLNDCDETLLLEHSHKQFNDCIQPLIQRLRACILFFNTNIHDGIKKFALFRLFTLFSKPTEHSAICLTYLICCYRKQCVCECV